MRTPRIVHHARCIVAFSAIFFQWNVYADGAVLRGRMQGTSKSSSTGTPNNMSRNAVPVPLGDDAQLDLEAPSNATTMPSPGQTVPRKILTHRKPPKHIDEYLDRERRTCSDSYSECCNGKCVRTSFIRDGDNDCGDSSDETYPAFKQCRTTTTCAAGSASKDGVFVASGMCYSNFELNDEFSKEGVTADGKDYYKAARSERYLYYDSDCDGKGTFGGRWIFDTDRPSTTSTKNLDGESECSISGYTDSTSKTPPVDSAWRIYCSELSGWSPNMWPFGERCSNHGTCISGSFDFEEEFTVRGLCPGATGADALFRKEGKTADDRDFYKTSHSDLYLYYDSDCDGKGTRGRWIFDTDRPSTTSTKNLDGHSQCIISGYTDSTSKTPPMDAQWRIYCSGEWKDGIQVIFADKATCSCDEGFHGDHCGVGIGSNIIASPGVHDTFTIDTGVCQDGPLNDEFSKEGVTADGKDYYKAARSERYLYYDSDCDGKGTVGGRWIFDDDRPSTTSTKNLDGESECIIFGYIDSSSETPPTSTNDVWKIWCPGWVYTTVVVHTDHGCAKGTKKGSGQACVSCAANEYQPLDKYEGLTCTPQPYCGRGQKTSADTKLAKRTCASCTSGQYQDSSSHRDVACKAQPSCARGEKISSASVRTKQTCSQCPDGYYQDTSSHSEVTCKAQPYCGKDQKISTPSSAVLQTCSSCPAGQIQPTTSHREASCTSQCGANSYFILDGGRASCTPQPFCSAGQKMSPDSAISKRTCSSCGTRTYQDSQRHRETTCKPQPLCDKGRYLPSSKGTTVKKQLCEACPDNTYQQLDSFAGTSCTVQATCNAGFYISAPSKVTKQECTPCPIGEYQVSNNHRNTKCLKQPESKCQKGEYVSGVSATTKGFCKEDIPCGEDRIYVRLLGEEGKCVACPDGTAQPLTAHFESICSATVRCDLPSRELGSTSTFTDAVTCNGRGTASQSGECACELGTTGCQCQCTIGPNTDGTCFSCASGYAGIRCQFSDKDSCSGRGAVQSDGTCNDCERGSAGTYCEFTDDDYCCGAGSVNDQGVCGQCGPGYSGTHCEHADGITCFGNGEAQGDGSCLCKDGFNAETNCAECNLNIASSGSSGDELCDTCVPEMLGSSFPACDIPTCTKHGVASASGLECVCGVGWRGDRCECFDDNAGEESACLACANGDDGVAYTMKSGACEMNGKRRRGGSSFGSVVGDIPAPRISAGGASASKHRNRRFDWSCATTTTTTTLSKSPTTSPITTTTSTENPLFVRLRAEEAEALQQYEQRRADHEERLASHDLIVEEFEKKCGGVDGGRARRNSSDEGNMACNEFDVRPCLQGECKPCFSGKKQSKSGDACDVACGDCVLYANSCINADDDDDTDDADDDGDDAVQSEADQKATECAFLKKQFEDSERSLAAAKQALDRADTAKTAASTAYTTALDDAASAERECLLLSQEGIDSQTIVLIVAFILLAIAQGGARFTRQYDQHKVSLTVEVIVFFSILDQITDVTYVITETFRSGTLKALGTTFCILPVITMMVYFYYKCYRVTTKENLIWRFKQAIRPFTDVPKGLMYTVVYPVFALMLSAILMVVVFLPLPLEAALLPLEMGFRIGFGKGKELAVWANAKAESWSEKTILGLIPSILLYCGVFVYAILTMVYHVLLAVFLPFLWAIMMVVRTFAILPGVWVWIENECDFMLQHMKEPSPTGLFAYQSPRKSAACGEDLGVFRLFHPNSEDSTPKNKVPIIDYEAQYLMLSGTLVFEFVFESLPQIIIQIVNNFENESWAKTECVDILDGDAIKRIGWRTFTVMSVVLSGFVAIDSLYRQLFQTFVKKQPFGSPASFGVKDDEQKHIKKGLEMREDVGKMETLRKQRRTSMKEAQKKAGRVQKKAKSRAARGADSGLVSFAKPNRARGSGRPKNKSNTKLNPMFQSKATFENPMYSFDNTVDGYMDVNN